MLPGKQREREENSLIFKVGKLENDGFAVAKKKQSLELTYKHKKKKVIQYYIILVAWVQNRDFKNNIIFLTEPEGRCLL